MNRTNFDIHKDEIFTDEDLWNLLNTGETYFCKKIRDIMGQNVCSYGPCYKCREQQLEWLKKVVD